MGMAERLILCSGCGTKNRIASGVAGQPKCGSCGKPLTVPGFSGGGGGVLKKPLTWLVIGGIVFGGYHLIQQDKKSGVRYSNSGSTPTSIVAQAAEPTFNESPIQASHGVMQRSSRQGVAPLGVKTSRGSNYFVKLVDMSGRTVMTMFIYGGRYFETEVPLGTYEMRYASGATWYGPKHLFGPKTSYAKADSRFDFRLNGNTYSGYTVELISQVGGNLSTSHISPANF